MHQVLVQDPSSQLARGHDDQLMIMARIMAFQLNNQLLPAWDRAQSLVEYLPDPEMLKDRPNAFVNVLLDTPDAPSVLGYHVKAGSKIFLRPSFDAGSELLTGQYAVSGVACHEAFEAALDRPTNRWVQMNDSVMVCLESADGCEGDPCPITLKDGTVGMGSNFLLQEWFDPTEMVGPFDFLTSKDPTRSLALPSAFSLSPGGYMITMAVVPGSEGQVTAARIPEETMERVGATDVRVIDGHHYLFGSAVPEWRKQHVLKHGRRARKRHALESRTI